MALSNQLFAQNINNYVFSTNQTSSLNVDLNSNPIDMTVGTTTLIGSSVGNGSGSGFINFPNNFDCWFMGTRATSFTVSSNGWLGLNNALTSADRWLIGDGLKIAPLLLINPQNSQAMGTSPSGKIHYKLVGVAPNRTLVVEYLNMTITHFPMGSQTNNATFHVRIYEATGVIEFVYGNISNASSENVGGNIGISNTGSSFLSVNITNHTSSSTISSFMQLAPGNISALSGGGSASTRRAYVFSPNSINPPSLLSFNAIGNNTITLNWVNNALTPNAAINNAIYYSTNGNDWIFVTSLTPTISTFQFTALTPSTSYFFKIIAIRESNSPNLIGKASTLASTLARSTAAGGGWKSPATWLGGVVPNINDSVVISDNATVIIDTTASCYKLTVGGGISGSLVYDFSVARTLNVGESILVSNGASFTAGSGVLITHQLNIGSSPNALASGSLVNNGTFDMQTTAGVTVSFLGRLNGVISGTGNITDFRQITVNKGVVSTNRPILDITAPFTVQGGNTLGLLSTHTAGILRINGSFTQSNPIYTTANYVIPLNGGLVLNNPNFTITSTNGSPTCNGLLQITQGVYNVSQTVTQILSFGNWAEFTVNGGTINAASRINSSNTITFNFSSGIINVAMVGNTANGSASFGLTNTSSTINWSGGILNLVQKSTFIDYSITPFVTSMSGTLNVGTAATLSNQAFTLDGSAPNIFIDTTNVKKSATCSSLRMLKNFTLHENTRFNAGSRLIFLADTFRNNGIIGGGNIEFASTSSTQVYLGTGSDTLTAITNRNTSGGVLFNKPVVAYGVRFFAPTSFINSNNITLGNGLNQPVSVQFGETEFILTVSGFDTAPIFNLGTGSYSLTYAKEATQRRTGTEIPSTRSITNLTINNSNGVLLAGGNLALTGTLNLTSGILTSSDTTVLHIVNSSTSSITGGGYIRGPLIRRLPASLSGSTQYLFPVGRTIFLSNTRTNAGGTVDIKIQYFDTLSGGTPNSGNLAALAAGYFSVSILSGATNIDSTIIFYAQSGLTTANRLAYSTTLTGLYSPISGPAFPGGSVTSFNLIGPTNIQGFFSIGFALPISGSYLIGSTKTAPNYTSLTTFLNDLAGKQVQGNVTLLLDNDYISTGEAFPITFNKFFSNNANWTITVKPNAGVNPIISGTSTTSIICIAGATNYIIDGSNNGSNSRNLTIQNLNTGNNTAGIWISSIATYQSSSNNIIRNLKIACGADQTTSINNTFGIISCGNVIPQASFNFGSSGNDSNQIINNEITRVRYGIYSIGNHQLFPNNGNRIESNLIGPTTFGVNQIGAVGINIQNEQNITIDNNEIRFVGGLSSHTATGNIRSGICIGTMTWPSLTYGFVNKLRVTKNKIHDIVDEKGFAAVGLLVTAAGSGNLVVNNDIFRIRSNASTAGIGLTHSNNDSILFNTIHLTGDLDPPGVATSYPKLYGLSISSSFVSNPTIFNNIISIDVNSNENVLHAAVNVTENFAWGTLFSNKNILFVPSSNSQMRIGCISGGSDFRFFQSLNDWQVATGQDVASISLNPELNNPLNSTLTLTSPAIGSGIAIPGYDKDMLDSNRSNPPTIGAYEKPVDINSPTINFSNLFNDTSLLVRNLISLVTITDASGINNTINSKPRIYFKKIQDANIFGANNNSTNGWKWVEATNNISPYSFNINYNLLFTPATLNDTIQYFIVAQDNAPNPNTGSFPLAGFQATSVNNVINAPSSPLTYKITLAPLSGTYFVGATQTFPTISSAILATFNRGITAPVNFVLTDTIYSASTGEQFPIEVRPIPGASSTNTVTLSPNNSVTTVIRDSINNPLFNLNGVNYFNIDGRKISSSTPKYLLISNTHVGVNAAAIRFINDACNNRLESTILLGANAPSNGNAGVIVFSTGVVTGNDKNSINNCEIGNALTNNRPSTLIYSLGSTDVVTKFNDSNLVSNCFLYNYVNPTNEFNAFKILDGNNTWTISDNHIYQTLPITTSALHYVFNLQANPTGTALNNMKLFRNHVGGSAPFCGGAPWTQNTSAGRLTSQFNMGNIGVNEFKGNKICNFLYNSTSSVFPLWQVIDFQRGWLAIDSNIIGSTSGRDSIIISSTNNATLVLITLNSFQQGDHFIRGNSIGAIRVGGISNSISLTLIRTGTNSSSKFIKYNIINNNFGNLQDSNIVSSFSSNAVGKSIIGISNQQNCTMNIQNNIFRNFLNNYTLPSGIAVIHVITTTNGINTIVNNQIFNISNTCLTQNNNTTLAAIIGILATPSTTVNYIGQNRIYNLSATNTSASSVTISGIVINNLSNSMVEGNFIHSLITAGSGISSSINGINYLGGSSNRIANNMIRLGVNTNGISMMTTPAIQGIHRGGTTGTFSLFFNTIYIGGSSVQTGLNNTFAFSRTFNGTDSIINNIFMNVRSNSTTTGGTHYAIGLNNTTGLFSNHNLYYVDTANFGDMLTRIGTINYPNLASFKNVSLTDANSVSSNPYFIAPNAAAPFIDLHINQGIPTPVESAGLPITGISNDYDNQLRNNLTSVDIGADEGNFSSLDLSPPQITYTNFTRDTVSSQRIIAGQVLISDLSVINTSSFKPRIYYKKKTNANVFLGNTSASNGWKFVEAANTSSPFSFTIDYTILTGGAVVIGDTIQYFVIAQDSLGNIGSNPSLGTVSTSTANVTVAPSTPNFYAIIDKPLRGTYLIGSAQLSPNFNSLTQAISALNLRGIGENVVFELRDANYTSPSETFPLVISEIHGANAFHRLTIRPGNGVSAIISGNHPSSILTLNGADYVIIDGSNNGTNSRNLTLTNTNVNGTSSIIIGQATLDNNPITFNTIKNLKIFGASLSATTWGINFIPSSGSFTTAIGNSNNIISNCEIKDVTNGIHLKGRFIHAKDQNNTVSLNIISNVLHTGVLTTFQNNLLIESNIIQSGSPSNTRYGVSLGHLDYFSEAYEVSNAIVRNNKIGPIFGSGGDITSGIYVAPATTGITSIYNNLIVEIHATPLEDYFVAGIYVGRGTGAITRIFHNTISMSSPVMSKYYNRYAILVGANNPIVDIRNNIFLNTLATSGIGRNFAIGLRSNSLTNLTLDYNTYFSSGTFGKIGVIGGTGAIGTGIEYATLNAFRAATGKDANSVNKAVTFVSTTDAHLAGASIGDTSLRCLPIPGITTDIDNELRNTTFTYMGADEIVSNPLPVKLLSFNAQAVSADARVTWTTAAEVNNKGFELERSFDGKTFEFAQFIEGAGNSNKINSYQYIDAGILAKTPVVYYRLKQVDYNGRFEYSETVMVRKPKTSSNEVVVYPNPTSGIISLLIETDVEENYGVTITDMNGKVVYTNQLLAQQGNNQIALPGSDELISGIYFVRVTGQQLTKVIKLVKTN